jgi:phosphohistidine phosphatase
MKLYFLRHGLADWPEWTGSDSDRPLTPEGNKRMRSQASTLAELGLSVDVLLSSPLTRAKQTADLLGASLGVRVVVDRALGPGFGIERLKIVLADNPGAGSVMLVGHEPDFSTCISALIGGGRIILKKGGLARVDIDSSDPLRGQLVWLAAPKLLASE